MKTRHSIRRVRYDAPAPYGVEVMTLAQLHAMAPPGYLHRPQRPDFHLLVLATAGQTTHTIDFCEYDIGPGESLWVRPGQIQRFNTAQAGAADLVLVQPDFLIPGTIAAQIAADHFAPNKYGSPDTHSESLEHARHALHIEYDAAMGSSHAPDVTRTETLRHLLSILILRIAGDSPPPRATQPGLYQQFRDLLEHDFAIAHDVDHYARTLGYSTRTASPWRPRDCSLIPTAQSRASHPSSASATRRTSQPSSRHK